jgi:heme/copper-type cytochrome/quinol oxidase subunit 2
MLIFIRKYRKDRHPKAIQDEGSVKLEIIWTVIPIMLVLVMFYFDELSVTEITEVTNLTESNVKVKLHRGRKKLFELLKGILKDEIISIL